MVHDTFMTQRASAVDINIKKKVEALHHKTKEAPKAEFPWKRKEILLSSIFLNVLALILPIVILQLYDRIIPNQSLNTLTILGVGVGIAIIFEAILRMARSYILGWIGQRFDYGSSQGMFSHLLGGNLYDLNKMGVGEHVENIESLSTIKEFMAGQGFLVLVDMPFMFFFLGLISYFGGILLALSCVIVLVIFVFVSMHVGHTLHDALQERYELGDRKYNFVIEALNNFFTIKSLGMEEQILRRFERLQFQASYLEYKMNILSAEARDVGSLFSSILFGFIVTLASVSVIDNKISAGAMAACLFLSNRLIQPLQMALGMWARFQYFRISQKRFNKVFNTPLEMNEGIQKHIKGDITLKGISFHYPGDSRSLYKSANLDVKAGEFVTIIGESGAGKTTLSQIMIGNIIPEKGKVLIDQTPLMQLNMPTFREQIAYLPPKGEIFRGTVLENLTFFSTHDFTDEAMRLSKEVGLDRWVTQLPLGYNTIIGGHLDDDLPLGMLQRLCLVRGLLMEPKILILDEANTSLDAEGDRDLLKLLERLKGSTTIVFITHRPSVARVSDKVFRIIDGKIVLQEEHRHGL